MGVKYSDLGDFAPFGQSGQTVGPQFGGEIDAKRRLKQTSTAAAAPRLTCCSHKINVRPNKLSLYPPSIKILSRTCATRLPVETVETPHGLAAGFTLKAHSVECPSRNGAQLGTRANLHHAPRRPKMDRHQTPPPPARKEVFLGCSSENQVSRLRSTVTFSLPGSWAQIVWYIIVNTIVAV